MKVIYLGGDLGKQEYEAGKTHIEVGFFFVNIFIKI